MKSKRSCLASLMRRPADETYLYRFFGVDDELLYVGITGDFGRRWQQHIHEKSWWGHVRRMTSEVKDTWQLARKAELKAIAVEYPTYNVADAPPERRATQELTRMLQNGKVPDDPRMTRLLWELAQALADHLIDKSVPRVLREPADDHRTQSREEKSRENRVRRMAQRQGLTLVRSRTRDPVALDYGKYQLQACDGEPADIDSKCDVTLAEIEEWLVVGRRSQSAEEPSVHPAHLLMRELLAASGSIGLQVSRLVFLMDSAVTRQTVHTWLKQDEQLGLVRHLSNTNSRQARWIVSECADQQALA